MRIILVTSSESLSGGTRQCAYLARGLSEAGNDVSIFVPAKADAPALDPGLNWREMPARRGDWEKAVRAALPKGPCVVHAFHNKAVKKLSWWGLSWRRQGAVCLGHRGVVFRPGNPLPYWSPGLDAFTVNSMACGRILGKMGVGRKRLFVVYNGIPEARVTPVISRADMRRELDAGDETFLFGTVAGDKPVKGVEPLLKSFAALRRDHPRAKLVLVGARPKRWTPLARELGIDGAAHFAGRRENVADYLGAMDAFVLPSLSESMPNTLLEAFFFALPAVASAVGGVPELLNGTGLAVNPGDVDGLSRAMARMMDDDTARKDWSKTAQAMAENFTIRAKVNRCLEVYGKLMARRGLGGDV